MGRRHCCCGCITPRYPYLFPDKDFGTISTVQTTTLHTRVVTRVTRRTESYDGGGDYTNVSNIQQSLTDVTTQETTEVVNAKNRTGYTSHVLPGMSSSSDAPYVYDPPAAEGDPEAHPNHTRYRDRTRITTTYQEEDWYRLALTFDVSGITVDQAVAPDGANYETSNAFAFYTLPAIHGQGDVAFAAHKVYGVETDVLPPQTSVAFDARLATAIELTNTGNQHKYYDLRGTFTTASTITLLLYDDAGAVDIDSPHWSHMRPYSSDRIHLSGFDTSIASIATLTPNTNGRQTDWRSHFDYQDVAGTRTWEVIRSLPTHDMRFEFVYITEGNPYMAHPAPYQFDIVFTDTTDSDVLTLVFDFTSVVVVPSGTTVVSGSLAVTGITGIHNFDVSFPVASTGNPQEQSPLVVQIGLYDNTVHVSFGSSSYHYDKVEYTDTVSGEQHKKALILERIVPAVATDRMKVKLVSASSHFVPLAITYKETAPIAQSEIYGGYIEEVATSDCPDPVRNCTLIGTEESLNIKWDLTAGGFSVSDQQSAGSVCSVSGYAHFGDPGQYVHSYGVPYFWSGKTETTFTGSLVSTLYADDTPGFNDPAHHATMVDDSFSIGAPSLVTFAEELATEGRLSVNFTAFLSRATNGELQLNVTVTLHFPDSFFDFYNPSGYLRAINGIGRSIGTQGVGPPFIPPWEGMFGEATTTTAPDGCATGYAMYSTGKIKASTVPLQATFFSIHTPMSTFDGRAVESVSREGTIAWVRNLGITQLDRLSDLPTETFSATDPAAIYGGFAGNPDVSAAGYGPTNVPVMKSLSGVAMTTHNIVEQEYTGASDCTPPHSANFDRQILTGNRSAGMATYEARITQPL